MKSLRCNDYAIDVLFGEIASIVAIAFGLSMFWKMVLKSNPIVSIVCVIFHIFVPALLLFSLNKYNVKCAKRFLWTWEAYVVLFFLFSCARMIGDFRFFWKVILPIAVITICMLTGVNGVIRIEEPDESNLPILSKIPETQCNLLRLMDSITYLIALVSTFVLMVLIGKYFHDFLLMNWQSFEKQRVRVFLVGLFIGYYPAKILGSIVSCVFTFLVNRIYEYYTKSPC